MPAPATTDDLLDLINRSGLFDPERLEACAAAARDAGWADTPQDLAHALVRAGLLTQFHAEQFLLGKYRGFVIGKYKVLERLGFGGMGIVYLCEHAVMRKRVAVKVLPTSKNDSPAALGRFYREARAAGSLEHPNLVKAHDVDREGNLHYLVMDYVDGASLYQIVARTGPMSAARAAHYVRQAAQGLEHARLAGLVHRDVKPANILVDRQGVVRILDLGLARFFQDETDPLTMKYDEKNVLGTADYVAPEQAINSHDVDTRADIYSLGCTFYFLLAGHPPFPDGKAAQKLIWHQVKNPRPIRQLRSDVPEGLAAVIEKMMAKDPAKRYQTPGELVAALEPWTREPVPPPSEDEVPRLCAAASAGPSSAEINIGPAAPSPAGRRPAGHTPGACARPAAVAARARPRPAPAEELTPGPTAAETDKTRLPKRPLPPPPRPAKAPEPLPAPAAPEVPRAAPALSLPVQAVRLAAILLLGIAATVGVRWALTRSPRPALRLPWAAAAPAVAPAVAPAEARG